MVQQHAVPKRTVPMRRYRSASSCQTQKMQQTQFMPLSALQTPRPRHITLPLTFKTPIKLLVRQSDSATLPVNILLWSFPNVQPTRVTPNCTGRPRSLSTPQSTSQENEIIYLKNITDLYITNNVFSVWVTVILWWCFCCSESLDFICLWRWLLKPIRKIRTCLFHRRRSSQRGRVLLYHTVVRYTTPTLRSTEFKHNECECILSIWIE